MLLVSTVQQCESALCRHLSPNHASIIFLKFLFLLEILTFKILLTVFSLHAYVFIYIYDFKFSYFVKGFQCLIDYCNLWVSLELELK